MIDVLNISVRFGEQTVLNNVSFHIDDNDHIAIIGRSGCGKTVLIKTIIGLIKPSQGSVIYHNKGEIRALPNFGVVFQNSALLDSFNVYQNVALPLIEHTTMAEHLIEDKVKKTLELLGLPGVMKLYPPELSGGMRKRVGIARAMVLEPEYIVFDEPTSGLDPITSNEIIEYIKRILRLNNLTALIITHDIKCISELSEKILYLVNGGINFLDYKTELEDVKNVEAKNFYNEFIL